MDKMEDIKKREAILVAKTVINMPKYKVTGHATSPIKVYMSGDFRSFTHALESPPKNTTSILVIYLNDSK